MKRVVLSTVVVLGLALTGCGRSGPPPGYALRGESTAPGADAQLQVNTRGAGNQEVELTVENLPPPQRIDEQASSYAVWVHPTGRDPIQLGNLDYDEEARRGGIRTITPYQQFELFVTAEQVAAPLEPTGPRVIQWRTPAPSE